MKEYRIEIVRRANGRFAWVFVVRGESKRCVLARSTRDYRSLKRVKRAVERMQCAPIEECAPDPETFELPATSLLIDTRVVPLIVEEFPTEFATTSGRADGGEAQRRTTALQAGASEASPEPKAKAKRASSRRSKPRSRRGRSAA